MASEPIAGLRLCPS